MFSYEDAKIVTILEVEGAHHAVRNGNVVVPEMACAQDAHVATVQVLTTGTLKLC